MNWANSASCPLPGLDPTAEKLLEEHAQIPAGVVEFLGLFVAPRQEDLVETNHPIRFARRKQAFEAALGLLQVSDEIP